MASTLNDSMRSTYSGPSLATIQTIEMPLSASFRIAHHRSLEPRQPMIQCPQALVDVPSSLDGDDAVAIGSLCNNF
ncbi:unnamed protein product, partial [Mesorhabditis belari]|uniref:Uncharacterized protein n=1 Tax=Mesorhabditis belari TaxID=2138241 RepID=A0AAF3EC73_9BILA